MQSLLDNVLLWLCLPLLPTLVGARVGVLIGVFVGVSTRSRVEAIPHPLAVSAPPNPVIPELHGYIQPLVEVLWSTVPAKNIREEDSIGKSGSAVCIDRIGLSVVEGRL